MKPLTNRELFSIDQLPNQLTVIGAGPIGIEMAQSFSRLGTQVTVVDMAKQILPAEDEDIAEMLQIRLEGEGVKFSLGANVLSMGESHDKKQVIIKNATNLTQELLSDEVLLAVGRKPNVDSLGLKKIGVVTKKCGIDVDARLRTNFKHIYAAGDVNALAPFTHGAGYEGGIVVSNIAFHLPRKANYKYLPWCTYSKPECASIGFNEKRARSSGLSYSVFSEDFQHNDRSLAEDEAFGKVKLLLDKKGKTLGAQILGPHAGELLASWIVMMNTQSKLSTFAGSIHPYPTMIEINKRVAGNYFGEKIFSPKVRKILKMLFRYQG